MGLREDINRPKETPLHSTGYGELAGADGSAVGDIGLSIQQRKTLDNRRRFVPKYGHSELGRAYVPAALRRYQPRVASKTVKIGERPVDKRQAINAASAGKPPVSQRGFIEPPKRTYNPYK